MILRVLWVWDALVTLVFVVFFFIGLDDGSVSSFNIRLWITVLSGLAAVLVGGLALQAGGYRRMATLFLLLPGIPGALYALFFLVLLLTNPRWN